MSTTVQLDPSMVSAVALVGNVVTVGARQFVAYSVEGPSWYAFLAEDGSVTVDCSMTVADWIKEPWAMVLPMGVGIGEGYAQEYPVSLLRRGVSLEKAWR